MNRVFIILLICIILYDLYDCDIIEGVAKVNIDDFNILVGKLAIMRTDDGADGGAMLGDTDDGTDDANTDGDTDDGADDGAMFSDTYDGPMVGTIQLDNKSDHLKNNILDLTSILTLENREATPSINTHNVTNDRNNGCIIS